MGRAPAGVALATALLALAACSPPGQPISPSGSTDSGSPSASGSEGAATAGLAGQSPASTGSASGQDCAVSVGSQLRERTTVTAAGAVTMLAGTLPCRSVGVWVSSFALDGDAAADPTPQFVGLYTGTTTMTAALPPVGAPCSAAAVYFAAAAEDATATSAAATAAVTIRSDLTYWPPRQSATVPGGEILQGRASAVLAAAVGGDPAKCSPGARIPTPLAAIGDCWLATPSPAAPSGTPGIAANPSAQPGGGFRKTTCGAQHTHEVYWVETLTTRAYLAQRISASENASTWARRRANDVCSDRRTALRLASDVSFGQIFLELLWPSNLAYPPTGPTGWSKAQIVCLARWKDGKPSDRHLLHR